MPDLTPIYARDNLAYVHGMKPIYEHGGFLGTVGEYTTKAM